MSIAKNFMETIRLWWTHHKLMLEKARTEPFRQAALESIAAKRYDFTPELKAEIEAALSIYWQQPAACLACGGLDWALVDGFATVLVVQNFWMNTGRSGLPSAAFVCNRCGFTMLFNLITLGFKDSIGPKTPF